MAKHYEPKKFALKGLQGISDGVLQDHLKLYEGYVTNTNKLTEELEKLTKDGKAAGTNPAYAEMSRRLGFEYNGMILHEYYFANLTASAAPIDAARRLTDALAKSFGTLENFWADFKAVATMRGIGWAIAFQNPDNGLISNHWVTLHEDGNPAGFKPIVVMDAWEHAFVPDYKPFERAKYVEAYLKNVDWKACEARLLK